MNLRVTFLLASLGLASCLLVAGLQTSPGYMDAEYYYQGGVRLAAGFGFSEPFLWNYLDEPSGLPHPSHVYWLPLASILAATGMRLAGSLSFEDARLGSILLAACIPPLTAGLAYSFTGRRRDAIFAGLLAAFPGFYLPFLPTTDTFGIYMVLGAVWFLIARQTQSRKRALGLGVVSGLFQLARADGMVWLGLSLVAILVDGLSPIETTTYASKKLSRLSARFSRALPGLGIVLGGYLVVAGPWFLRNLEVTGSLLSPGGGHALWITGYDDLYVYPAGILTASRWWASGLGAILQARGWAAGQNLQTWLAVQSEIFLAPLVLAGLWTLRRDRRVGFAILAWLATFGLMTLVFPYQGARGGFFHSGAAIQPLLWAVAPAGLSGMVSWGARLRNWKSAQAWGFFATGAVALSILLSFWLVKQKVTGTDLANPVWNQSAARYGRLEQGLQALGASPGEVVLVNNPPGYYNASARPAVPIPYGDLQALLSAASRYQARYLLLEFNQMPGVDDLYAAPGDRPGLRYLATVETTRIYQVLDSQ